MGLAYMLDRAPQSPEEYQLVSYTVMQWVDAQPKDIRRLVHIYDMTAVYFLMVKKGYRNAETMEPILKKLFPGADDGRAQHPKRHPRRRF